MSCFSQQFWAVWRAEFPEFLFDCTILESCGGAGDQFVDVALLDSKTKARLAALPNCADGAALGLMLARAAEAQRKASATATPQ